VGEIEECGEMRRGGGTLASALLPRVDEGVETRLGDESRTAGRHLAHQLRQHALRQRIRLDLVFRGESYEAGRVDKCARDGSLEQSFVREMRGAERRAIADADDADGRQTSRSALREKPALDR